ncbi:MAG: protein-disulfide reductase DsbD family protein, partial [Ekhidna sp.]|nr:protein-disulfide reductase DsbD family protein [Ekhidna sp.]
MKKIIIFGVSLGCLGLVVFSQVLKPIKWKVNLSDNSLKAGDEIVLSFEAEIDNDWYLYSSDFDSELGPMITEFNFDVDGSFELIGKIKPINPKKKYDSLWEGEYTYFKKKGLFRQKIKILKDDFTIAGSYFYQVCSVIDGKCIPFEDEFSFVSDQMQTMIIDDDLTQRDGSSWTSLI